MIQAGATIFARPYFSNAGVHRYDFFTRYNFSVWVLSDVISVGRPWTESLIASPFSFWVVHHE